MTSIRRDILIGLACLVLAIALPIVMPGRYVITQSTLFFIWAIVVVQWNLVLGIGGIFSLAQMALFATGAYATAMLGFYWKVPMLAAIPMAGLITVAVGMLIGLACLRLRGPYVALLTLAIAQVMYVLIVNDTDCFTTTGGCMPLFGGVRGIGQFGDIGLRALFPSKWYVAHYYVGLALLAVAVTISIVVIRGPLGLAFRALRDNPGYAMSRGISRFKYQLWIFAVSAFFTGIAGGFYAVHFRVVGPTVFSFSTLLFLIAMIVIGGLGSIWGPLLGAAVLMLADEGMRELSDYRNIGLGLLLAVFVIAWPNGLNGWLQRSRTNRG
ncbi:MAG: branched-chain amino acid ABC transporter permease [Mesorhizobium sp.]|uniref:branched-chain amino acid ABC transporter permease n=1 Tax=Mesorhizobium sp. TaxID=1871066 RepID=UPI000FEAA36D|nr:branched-chain amino acid ABC transporter permease [Mesorhizobium sp.]RWL78831.1 MAG: branched-chain amino acid ABC transporter permease [Mesorhizobium sp.]RWL84037.1 MAG: branched-chain amino acid ABC transporter permease [Mesorhizobium sp.]RWL94811.1 MAG: branched-chain amino acid ABC transporter permease [Mesorhizobium sp.]